MNNEADALADRFAARADLAESLGYDPGPFRDAEKCAHMCAVMGAVSDDAGSRMAALEDDTVTLDERMTGIKRMWELEDDGYYTAYCTGVIPIITTDEDPGTMDCG